MKISHKIPLISSLIIISAFSFFSWIQFNTVRDNAYTTIQNNVDESSKALSQHISHWLNGKLSLIDLMSENINGNYSPDNVQSIMNTELLKEEFILIFGASESDGKPISNTPSWNPGEKWDGRQRPWYPLARSHHQAVLTSPYIDSATGDILISAVASLYDNEKFNGAFGGDLSLEAVSKAVNAVNFNGTGYAFLLDTSGNIISHPNSEMNGKKLNQLFTQKAPRLIERLQEIELNSSILLTSYKPIKDIYGSQWLIGVVLEKDKVMSDVYLLSRNTLIAALITSLISSLLLFITLNTLVLKPIGKLTSISEEISRGENLSIDKKETERNDEIGALSRSIERMSNGLKLAVSQLSKGSST